jgi:hypothetical protein
MRTLALTWVLVIALSACSQPAIDAPANRLTDSIDASSAVGPEMMAAFGEAPLTRHANDFAVRIFYIPTFDHPFMVRHSSSGATGANRVVVLSGKGGYDPGTICHEASSESNEGQVQARISNLEDAGFWRSPSKDDVHGSDGAVLVIEVVESGKYRGWVRWAPTYKAHQRRLETLNLLLLDEILGESLVGVRCSEV